MKEAFSKIDKKTLKMAGIGIGVIVLIIIVISVLVRLTETAYNTYEEVEIKLVEAAQNYYATNNLYLPSVERGTSTVSSNTLVVGGYISPLNELLKNGEKCNAEVIVTKLSASFDYVALLDCGKDYHSLQLYKKVLEDNTIATGGIGLYLEDNEKVFKGEVKNNFIKLNEKLWRIIRIDEYNNLVLMSNFKTNSMLWDNRYNEETSSNYGISNYNLSRVKERIEDEYYNGELLADSEKSKVVQTKWCLGSRKSTDSGNMKNVECLEMSEEESPIGLLTVYEYMQASIDPNCKTIEDRGCTNYNYMHDRQSTFWTITKGQKNSSYVYNVIISGVVESRANTLKQVRYVIKLSPNTIFKSGSGLEEDPYIIR